MNVNMSHGVPRGFAKTPFIAHTAFPMFDRGVSMVDRHSYQRPGKGALHSRRYPIWRSYSVLYQDMRQPQEHKKKPRAFDSINAGMGNREKRMQINSIGLWALIRRNPKKIGRVQ